MKHSGLTASKDGDKLFVCSFPSCGKRFKTKFSMCRHNLVHSQEKNYTCEFCGKKFALLQYLKEHTNTHTSEKPYVCGVAGCQERFSQTGKLSLHRRTHPEYRLKKYHSNSGFNKRRHGSGSGDSISASMDFPEPSQGPKNEYSEVDSEPRRPEEPGRAELTATKRALQPQDSGQTAATTNGGEEWAKPPFILFARSPEAHGLQTTLTKEAIEENNNTTLPMSLELDNLIRYLSYLQLPCASAIRPVLPLPERVKAQKAHVSFQYTPLNLFELISKSGN